MTTEDTCNNCSRPCTECPGCRNSQFCTDCGRCNVCGDARRNAAERHSRAGNPAPRPGHKR